MNSRGLIVLQDFALVDQAWQLLAAPTGPVPHEEHALATSSSSCSGVIEISNTAWEAAARDHLGKLGKLGEK